MNHCRKIHELYGCPGQSAITNAIKYGSIIDCPVTATDMSYWYRNVLPKTGCNLCAFAKLTRASNNIRTVNMKRSLLLDTYFARGTKVNTPILMAIDSATKFNNPKMLDENTFSSIYKAISSVLNYARFKDVNYDNIVVDLDKPSGAATRLLKDNRNFEDIVRIPSDRYTRFRSRGR